MTYFPCESSPDCGTSLRDPGIFVGTRRPRGARGAEGTNDGLTFLALARGGPGVEAREQDEQQRAGQGRGNHGFRLEGCLLQGTELYTLFQHSQYGSNTHNGAHGSDKPKQHRPCYSAVHLHKSSSVCSNVRRQCAASPASGSVTTHTAHNNSSSQVWIRALSILLQLKEFSHQVTRGSFLG